MTLIVRAIFGGTSKYLTVKASNPAQALQRVSKREVKGATCFVVMIPRTGNNPAMPIHVCKA